MLSLFTDWIQTRRAENTLRRKALALAEQSLGRAWDANAYVDTEALQVRSSELLGMQPRRVNLDRARRIARYLAGEGSEHARNIVNQIVNHVVGDGFAVKFSDGDAADLWSAAARLVRWDRRARELVRRVVRDGEAFLRGFGDGSVRFVEPERVGTPAIQVAPDAKVLEGVEYQADDAETILAYYVLGPEMGHYERVPAAEMFHARDPFCDLNQLRGWPLLYDIRHALEAYDDWLERRALLNRIRTAFAFIRHHKGATPAQIRSFVDAVKAGTLTDSAGRSLAYQPSLGGVGLDASENIEYEFPRANLGSTEAADDGRALRLRVCAGCGLPEYMITCDASNSNFASTLVAQNPGIRSMRSWQEHFGAVFAELIRWLLHDETVEVSFAWPAMVTADILRDTQAYQLMYASGVLSTRTWQERAGLSPEQERAAMVEEEVG